MDGPRVAGLSGDTPVLHRLADGLRRGLHLQAGGLAGQEVFRDGGIELSTFAYPKGSRNEELDEKLLGHYKVLRGAYFLQITDKHQFKEGYVESLSLDNGNYSSQEQYEAQIDDILANLKAGKGRVVSLYSHAIGAGDWSITEDRLLYLLRKAKEMGLQFYTFQELQNW